MSGSRNRVLASIRVALGPARSDRLPIRGESKIGSVEPEGREEQKRLLALFEDRLRDYEVRVSRARPGEIAARVGDAVVQEGLGNLVLPTDLPGSWISHGLSEAVRMIQEGESSPLSKEDLAGADGVVTGCALAVAETGTIILDGGLAQGRRALSLLPDYHLCVVFSGQVVESVSQAIRVLAEGSDGPVRPLTFISGPSATSDIELVRVRGVHGPRTLDVILVEELGG